MKIKVVASCSKGNMTIIKFDNDKTLMIDCGVGVKKLKRECENEDFFIDSIDYLFLSHGHGDHVSSLNAVLKTYRPKMTFLSKDTYLKVEEIISQNEIDYKIVTSDSMYKTDYFSFYTLLCNHDFRSTLGFIFEFIDSGINKKIVYLTDSGYVNYEYLDIMKDSDAILLEANHDEEMLKRDHISYVVRRRIGGLDGHLSNKSFCEILDNIITRPVKVIAMHISADRNSPELIKDLFRKTIKRKYNVELHISKGVDSISLETIKI
jgi:phosphoribosyl 1,2-cyclic phosphodiesterase